MEAQETMRLRRLAAAVAAASFRPIDMDDRYVGLDLPEPFGTFVSSGEYDQTKELLSHTGGEILVVAGRAPSEACDLVLVGAGWMIMGNAFGKCISCAVGHEEVLSIIAQCKWAEAEALAHIRNCVDRIVERTLAA